MLAISSLVKIYLHAEPVDMRKSFDGLFGIIKSDLQIDVRDDQRPLRSPDGKHVFVDPEELQSILSGIDLSSIKKRKRYVAPNLIHRATEVDS
jgi:hypothetical protein